MSNWYQSFASSFEANNMQFPPHNGNPQPNPRRLSMGQMSDNLSLPRAIYPQSLVSSRPGSSCSIGSNSSGLEAPVMPPVHNKNYQESRYKTEMCRHWQESGTCPHDMQCLFAHGLNELRPFRGRHRKYKTQLCKAFHDRGFCSFGPRCSYIHSGIDIPSAISPIAINPPQYQRKFSTESIDSNLSDSPINTGFSGELEERLKSLSLMASNISSNMKAPVPQSPTGVRLSVFAEICKN